MATVSFASCVISTEDVNVRVRKAGEALSVGDLVETSSLDVSTKVDVTQALTGTLGICITAAALNEGVVIVETECTLNGVTATEGTTLYAKGTGLIGDSYSTDLASTEYVFRVGTGLGTSVLVDLKDAGIQKT